MPTAFQQIIFAVVKQIPAGKTITYKQVATAIGKPFAYRAVGNALNKNDDPAIPCHRVIRSDGKAGGYNKGYKKKKELLKSESKNSKSKMNPTLRQERRVSGRVF